MPDEGGLLLGDDAIVLPFSLLFGVRQDGMLRQKAGVFGLLELGNDKAELKHARMRLMGKLGESEEIEGKVSGDLAVLTME